MIVAAILEVANDDLGFANVIKKQRLHRIDVFHIHATEFGPQHVQKMAVQSFDQSDYVEIMFGHGGDDMVFAKYAQSPIRRWTKRER